MMSKLFLLATMVASTTALDASTKTIYEVCGCPSAAECPPNIAAGDVNTASGLFIPTTGEAANVAIGAVAPGPGYFCPHCKGMGAGESAMFNGDVFYADEDNPGKFKASKVIGAASGGCDTNDGADCTVPADMEVLYCPDLTQPVPKGCTGVDTTGNEPATTQDSTFFPVSFNDAAGKAKGDGEGNVWHNVPKGTTGIKGAFGIWCAGLLCDDACFAKGETAPVDGSYYKSFYGNCTEVAKGTAAPASGLFIPGGDCDVPAPGSVEAAERIPDPVKAKRAKLIAEGVKVADIPTDSYTKNAAGKALGQDGKVGAVQPTEVTKCAAGSKFTAKAGDAAAKCEACTGATFNAADDASTECAAHKTCTANGVGTVGTTSKDAVCKSAAAPAPVVPAAPAPAPAGAPAAPAKVVVPDEAVSGSTASAAAGMAPMAAALLVAYFQ